MKKCFCFDFDDTLATTDCKIIVRDENNFCVGLLTTAQYRSHKKRANDRYDFSQFDDEHFIHNANPTELMAFAKEVHDEGHDVYVITARSDSVGDAIASWLMGFKIIPIKVHAVGDDSGKVDIPEEKRKILMTLSQINDIVYFWDDHKENIDAVNDMKIKTYLV